MGKSARAPRTAKEMLAQLDSFFARTMNTLQESKKLWDVLTALRGPDQTDYRTKDHATAPIRRTALPKLADLWDHGEIYVGADFRSSEVGVVELPPMSEVHLRGHLIRAAQALELKTKERPESVTSDASV